MNDVPDSRRTSTCPQCGRRLDDATVSVDGVAVCPDCAHSVGVRDSSDRATGIFRPGMESTASGGDRFVVSGTLGQGGFGVVYRAFDRSLRRNAAIKTPRDPEKGFDADQFIQEARAASRLKHPNIVTVFDVGFENETPYIVSACIEGVTLRQWLEGAHASFETIANLCEKLCRAIGYAHSMGIVHRDVKPSNVIVDDQGEPHVLDFGLSKSRATGEAVEIRSSVPLGTPAYMSPEQARGDVEHIGKPADIYSLGVVLYQMLTLRLPFVGSPSRIIDAVLHDDPVRPREVDRRIPPALEAIAIKAMRKEPDRRYETAEAMADDLARFREGRPVKALGRHDARSLSMTARRGFIGGVAAFATCGLLGAALWLGWRAYRDDRRVRIRLRDGSSDQEVRWIPVDRYLGMESSDAEFHSPGDRSLSLQPGLYRVIVVSNGDVREVWRTVPHPRAPRDHAIVVGGRELRARWLAWDPGEEILLPAVEFVPVDVSGMEPFPASDLNYSHRNYSALAGPHRVPGFYLDRSTATVADVIDVFEDPITNVRNTPTAEATLPFPLAMEFAEARGVRLMRAWEWLSAATDGGKTGFPWGDEVLTNVTPASLLAVDVCRSRPSVTGLCSGAREWTETILPYTPISADAASDADSELLRRRLTAGVDFPVAAGATLPKLGASELRNFVARDEQVGAANLFAIRCSASI